MEIKTKEDLDKAIELHRELWDYLALVDYNNNMHSSEVKIKWPGRDKYTDGRIEVFGLEVITVPYVENTIVLWK